MRIGCLLHAPLLEGGKIIPRCFWTYSYLWLPLRGSCLQRRLRERQQYDRPCVSLPSSRASRATSLIRGRQGRMHFTFIIIPTLSTKRLSPLRTFSCSYLQSKPDSKTVPNYLFLRYFFIQLIEHRHKLIKRHRTAARSLLTNKRRFQLIAAACFFRFSLYLAVLFFFHHILHAPVFILLLSL